MPTAGEPAREAGPAAGSSAEPSTRPAEPGPLLDASFLARLEQLQLSTRRPLAGLYSGAHRSPRRGNSLDFADHRQYHPGDDFRRIDYHALARLGVLVLKLFEAEEDLPVRLVVDTSASMGFGGKLRSACQLAGALGFVALVRRDPVRIRTLERSRPPARFSGRTEAARLFTHLTELTAGGSTPFDEVVADLRSRRGPAGLTVMLSDLMSPQWPVALSRLPATGAELIVVHVLSADEVEPAAAGGDADLVDSETGERCPVSFTGEQLQRYRDALGRWRDELARGCARAGATYLPVIAGEPVEALLLGAWRRGGIVR